MEQVWKQLQKDWQDGYDVMQRLIERNWEAQDEAVIEFNDDARSAEECMEELKKLKVARYKLFEARDLCEEVVKSYQELIDKYGTK